MNPMEALMLPISDEDKMKMMAESLRGRKNAADFFALSSIKDIARNAKAEQQYVADVASRQGVLREALAKRKQDEAENQKKREFDAEQGELDRAALLQRSLNKAPLVTINGEGKPDYAAVTYYKERGKSDSKALDSIYNQAEVSRQLVNNLDSFKAVLNGVQTGSLSNVEADLGRLASSIGLDIGPNPDKLQAARAISNQLALLVRNPESGLGMPGNISNRDIEFLKQSMPRIVNSPGGNDLIIEIFSRINKRAIDRAEKASQFEQENGRFMKPEFERLWNDQINQQGLFDDLVVPEATQPMSADPTSAPPDYDSMPEDELDRRLLNYNQ